MLGIPRIHSILNLRSNRGLISGFPAQRIVITWVSVSPFREEVMHVPGFEPRASLRHLAFG